jgi:hypothetical protein
VDAHHVALLDVGALLEEQAAAGEVAVAGGEQQRGVAAVV